MAGHGTLVTDWDNGGRMVWEQRVCADAVEAATVAIRGNDLVMCTPSFFDGALEALDRGLVAESDIDGAVRRILTLKFELGLFEEPRGPDPARQAAVMVVLPMRPPISTWPGAAWSCCATTASFPSLVDWPRGPTGGHGRGRGAH